VKTIDKQIQAMAAQWPQFVVTERSESSAVWEGPLAPTVASISFGLPNY
jgi:hypothetical protein